MSPQPQPCHACGQTITTWGQWFEEPCPSTDLGHVIERPNDVLPFEATDTEE
jgi:hypothetical protein